MSKLKKLTAALMSMVMAGCLFTGCAAKPAGGGGAEAALENAAAPGEEECTISISWWGGESRHLATQEAINAFMDKYPNIKVESQFGAWNGWEENVATQLMSGTAPDLMQINWNWITSYSSDGSAFLDLNKVADVIDLSQWREADLNQCKVGDSLQAVPVALTGRIFYWNETTFQAAGLETPKSLADLMAAGPIFRDTLGEGYYPLVMNEYDRMIFCVDYLESKYGRNWVENGQVNYSEAEVQEAMDLLKKMEDEHVIPTLKKLAGDGADSLDKNQNWIDGLYAGILEWDTAATKFINAAPNSNVIVGEFFSDMGEYQGGFTKVSMGFAITSTSKHPKEAALLMQFLLGEEEGAKLMGSERGIPANAKALAICQADNLLDVNVVEASGKIADWCQFTLDPLFEDNALKSNPDGVYYKVMSKLSYGELDTAAAAAELLKGVNEVLSKG